MTKIISKYIFEVNWSVFVECGYIDKLIEDQVNEPNFRILKINNYEPIIKTLIEFLSNNKQVRKLLVASSHLFYVIIETVSEDLNLTIFEIVVDDIFKESQKSFLIELCYSSKNSVRYLLKDESVERLCAEDFFGFFEMQCVNESLAQCDLDLTILENLLSKKQHKWEPIAIRLMKTFDINTANEDFEKKMLKEFVSQSNLQALRAYLDLPITDNDDDDSLQQTPLTTKAVNHKYEDDETLLFYAANSDIDVLELLLRLGADVQVENTDSETASDYAKTNENLMLLLENDARFPHKFHETYNYLFKNGKGVIKKEIRKICKDREEFHAAITAKDEVKIKLFKKKFPLLKFAYTCTKEQRYSKAATTTALEMGTVDEDYTMYFLLLDEGFRLNEFDLSYMGIKYANKINVLTLSRLKREQPSHIAFLLSSTKIYGVNKCEHEKYMKQIHNIYNELDNYDKVTNLLKLLQHSKSLIISVDFRNTKVGSMDLKGICKGMDGVTYHELGRIYVGAAGKTNEEIAGFLIHELTHYVLHIVFNNNCKPYYKSDERNKLLFHGIIKKIKSQTGNHIVVKKAFFCYSKLYWPKELIVTVTQLIALKVNELELKEKYAELFDYFCFNVLPIVNKLANYPEEFHIKREVQQLNDFLGHTAEIENWNIWPQESILRPEINNGKDIQLVVCTTPRLFLADFYKSFVKPTLICSPDSINDHDYLKNYFILASIKDFKSASKAAYIQRIWNLNSSIMLLLNCDEFDESDETFGKRQCKYFNDNDTSKNLVAIAGEKRILELIFEAKNECIRLEYAWDSLEQSSRVKLLATEISFQGVSVELNNLIDDTFSGIPMTKLINGEKIVIEASKVVVDNYDDDKFVERSFTEYRNLDQILATTKNETSFLLSGEAGTGKSTMLSRITLKLKKEKPHFWVTRINLHEHVVAFEEQSINHPPEFVFKYLMKTKDSSERAFQHKLFQKLYESSKVIILLDAVDEVAPKFVLQVLTLIHILSEKIQLWITTRPHLKNDLENILSNKIVLEFSPFLENDQIKCATNYWKKELNLDGEINVHKLRVCAKSIISLFADSIVEWGAYTLLVTSMIAETYLKNVQEYVESSGQTLALPEYIDIFDLFKEFVIKKLLIVSNEKGTLVAKEKADNEIFSYIIAVFERFALKITFEFDTPNGYVYHDDHFLDKIVIIDRHNIQRCGLLVVSSNGETYFIHITFAEFFIANFVVKSLNNPPNSKDIAAKLKFKVAMDILFKSILLDFFEFTTLAKFIGEGMKYVRNNENEHEGLLQANRYFRNSDSDSDSFITLPFLLKANEIVLLHFFLESFTLHNDHEIIEKIFTECTLYHEASKRCVRCIVDYFWRKSPRDIFVKHLHKKTLFEIDPESEDIMFEGNAVQLAFMNFPAKKMDVVRDITSFEELKEAQSKKKVFDELLHKNTVEKYQKSTVKLIVDIILNPDARLNENEKFSFIYEYKKLDLCFVKYEIRPTFFRHYKISEEYFDDFIEMKWMAMIDLAFPIDDWEQLVNKTIFENVIYLIFNEFNNNNVLKFYKWAKCKANDDSAFKIFVGDTFSKYFWNCKSENGVKEIFDFIRSEVDIKEVLQHRDFADLFDIRYWENSYDSEAEVIKTHFFPICQKYFTEEEFQIFLFKPLKNSNRGTLFSKVCEDQNGELLESIILSILPLTTNEEFLRKIQHEVNSNMLFNLCYYMFSCLGTLNIFLIKRVLNCVEKISSLEHIRSALEHTKNNKNLFHVAANRRDLSMLQLMWNFARPRLSDKELEDLLLLGDADNFSM